MSGPPPPLQPGAAPLRVVHVITSLNRGGAEGVLARVVLGLDPARFAPSVVALLAGGALRRPLEARGIPVVELGLRRGRPSRLGLWRLARELRRLRPAVVSSWLYHADLAATLALPAAWRPSAGRPRLVWNVRCSLVEMSQYRRTSGLTRRALAALSRLPDAVVANSHAGQRDHIALGYRPRRWEVIPNGVDAAAFAPDPSAAAWLRAEAGLPADARVITHTGRFDPMKDHRGLLRAFAAVASRLPAARLVLTGHGLRADDLALNALIAREAPPDTVRVLGDRDDLARILGGADVACQSSAFGEGFPNVVAEAMACGTPCVVTDAGDAASVVGKTGRVVPPGAPERLADELLALLEEPPTERARRRDAARSRAVEEFPHERTVARFAALYEQLAGGQA